MALPYFTEGYLETGDGHRLYWSSCGNPEGKPVLLVHGGHGHVIDVTRFTALPLDTYRIIALHQRGIGKSRPLGMLQNNSLEDNADDMERLRRHLNIRKWDLFSWSFGAVFMALYAAKYPSHCGALISYGPYLATEQDWNVILQRDPEAGHKFFAHHQASTALEYVQNAFEKLMKASKETWQQSLFNIHHTAGGTETYEDFVASKTEEEWDRKLKESLVGAHHERSALEDYPAEWLAEITGESATFKTLDITLVFGAADPWAAENMATRRICPQARIVTIPVATHDIHALEVQENLCRLLTDIFPLSAARAA